MKGCCFFKVMLLLVISAYSVQAQTIAFDAFKQLYENYSFDSIIKIDKEKLIRDFKDKEGDIYKIYAEAYESLNQDDKAFDNYIKAKSYYKDVGHLDKVAGINADLYFLVDALENLKIDKTKYLKALKDYALSENSKKWQIVYYNLLGIENFDPKHKDSAKFYFAKANTLATEIDSLRASYNLLNNLGVLQLNLYNQPDSAVYYYNKALSLYKLDHKAGKKQNNLFDLYNNLGRAYIEKENYATALQYYKKADKVELKQYNDLSKRLLYGNMEVNYYYLKDFENAYDYLYKYDSINEIIKLGEQNANISEIEEKYQNEKLRADNIEIEAKNTQNRNIAFGLGGSLALGTIIVFLVYKNKKRKQALILQDKELKEKELTAKLKEQELASINAMIEGQEKERLRIANDLHDDLGGHMATIKMYFSSFEDQDSKNLFDKTNTLIEEAYQKIRNIAHTKNSGVMAKQGLLKAVKDLARNISKSEQVKVKVHDNGLDQRLENSLELTLFRIIQELIANVIKHANATEVDIHLSEDEGMLNIMVEDNGKGFDATQIIKNNKGMGLSSIDKRVESFDGKMIIESQPNSGTSVIIELPL